LNFQGFKPKSQFYFQLKLFFTKSNWWDIINHSQAGEYVIFHSVFRRLLAQLYAYLFFTFKQVQLF